MAVLTKDRNTTRKEGGLAAYPVAAGVKIYAGGIVCLNANGYAVPGTDTAGLKMEGISQQYVDNSAGAAGAESVLVWKTGIVDLDAAGMTIADVGKPVFVTDDHTVALTSTNAVGCGIISEVESATKVWVDIAPATRRTGKAQADSVAADVAALKTDFNTVLANLRTAGIIGS
jgi:hypothetical protein